MLHTIPPIYDSESKVLILGSFPSVKSREIQFFYGHPQNRFWKVMSAVLKCEIPNTIDEKRNMLLHNRIALWDVIHSCDIDGSDDSSIRNVVPNDLSFIIESTKIEKIYTNGNTAHNLYKKYCEQNTGISAKCLPSTSPANAGFSLERLIASWSAVFEV